MTKRLLFITLFFFSLTISAQQEVVDSLQLAIKDTNVDSAKVKLLLNLSIASRKLNIDQSIIHGQRALDLARSANYTIGIINGLSISAYNLHLQGENDLAIEYLQEAIVLTERTNYKKELPKIFNSLGGIHTDLGNFDKALEYFNRILELLDKEKQKGAIAAILTNIASIHTDQKDYERAIQYYELALTTAQDSENRRITAQILNAIGSLYLEQEEFDKALPYLNKYLDLGKVENDDIFISTALLNIGHVHLLKKESQIAENYLLKALKIKEEIGDERGEAYVLISLGELYQAKGKYIDSNRYYLESLKYFHDSKIKVKEQAIYKQLSQNYAKMGDFQNAFRAQEASTTLSDSLFTIEKNKQVLELATKYEIKQKETENKLLKEEQAKSKAIIERRTTLGIAIGLFFTLGSIFAFILYQQKKKNNQQLNRQVQLLNKNLESKKIIESQSEKLRLAEQQRNKIFTNITHEFQTPLTIIQGLSKQLFKTEQLSDSGTKALKFILKSSQSLSEATNQILKGNNLAQEANSVDLVLFSFLDLIKYLLPEFTFLAKKKKIRIQPPEFNHHQAIIYSDVSKLETVLKNLISNAIKYTDEGGIITIDYSMIENGYHQLRIMDSGRGIHEEELPYLFDRYYQSARTDPEGGFGLGLAICKENMTILGGSIDVDSKVGKGSSFTICLPKTPCEKIPGNIELYEFPKNEIPSLSENSQELVSSNTETDLLIVEDNKDFCKYLEILLKEDYHLHFTHNGQQALSFLVENNPTLIITDWMMPGTDGISFVEQLKASKKHRNIPVLMLTARSLTSDKIKALRIGVDDYLIKPFEEEVLKVRIRHLIDFKDRVEEYEKKSHFSSVLIDGQELSIEDQNWLINLEEIVMPSIGDFDLNLDKIVQLLGTNVKVLNRRIKNITGLTSKKYIQELRYWEARRMLETRAYDSVKAVCISVGFKDQKNFSRKFKGRFGVYPSSFLQISKS